MNDFKRDFFQVFSSRKKYFLYSLTVFCLAPFFISGCGGAPKKIVVQDFAEGRVVDLSITEKLTGSSDFVFFAIPKKSDFIDGYIQGVTALCGVSKETFTTPASKISN